MTMSHSQRKRAPSADPPSKRRRSRSPATSRPSSFPSYHAIPDLPVKIRLLCEILSTPSTPSSSSTLSLLDGTDFQLTQSDVESVLRLCYSYPGPALAFFRWAGERHLNHAHSPYAWNLIADLLGKNFLFDAMWNSVRSMRDLNILSLATFASIFSSLATAGRPAEALSTFISLPMYGIKRNTVALNSLLSALCRARLTVDGRAVLHEAQIVGVRPDADSFAILLEGCENERDDIAALNVLDDMVTTIGWDPRNVPAYDSFLITMISSSANGAREATHFLDILKGKDCSPSLKFFRTALKMCVDKSDERAATLIWRDYIAPGNSVPDITMYNSMIHLQCQENRMDEAVKYFDEMLPNGAFPDTDTYNILFEGFLRGRKIKEAASIFNEMIKNEFYPTEANCYHALKVSIGERDSDNAIKYWMCMVKNKMQPLEESGNFLVMGLCDEMDRLPEACKYAEFMIDNGIKLSSASMGKLKKGLSKIRKEEIHERILMKWRQCQK